MWNKLILLIIGLSICFTINGQIIKSYHLEYGVLKTSYELIEKGNIVPIPMLDEYGLILNVQLIQPCIGILETCNFWNHSIFKPTIGIIINVEKHVIKLSNCGMFYIFKF